MLRRTHYFLIATWLHALLRADGEPSVSPPPTGASRHAPSLHQTDISDCHQVALIRYQARAGGGIEAYRGWGEQDRLRDEQSRR
jgi:hypothetical protein